MTSSTAFSYTVSNIIICERKTYNNEVQIIIVHYSTTVRYYCVVLLILLMHGQDIMDTQRHLAVTRFHTAWRILNCLKIPFRVSCIIITSDWKKYIDQIRTEILSRNLKWFQHQSMSRYITWLQLLSFNFRGLLPLS